MNTEKPVKFQPTRLTCHWYFWLGLSTLALGLTPVRGNEFDAATFRIEYLAAEKHGRAQLQNLRVECLERVSSRRYATKKTVYVLGESRVGLNVFLGSAMPAGLAGTVHGINPDYYFYLHQPKPSGSYLLKDLQKKSMSDLEMRREFQSSVDQYAFAAFHVSNLPLSEIFNDPAVVIKSIRAVTSDDPNAGSLVDVEFDGALSDSPTALSGIVRLNRKNGWRVESFRNLTKKLPPDRPRLWYRSGELEYKEWPCGITFPKAIHVFKAESLDSPPVPYFEIEVLDVGLDELDDHHFRLSQYGISEPVEAEATGTTKTFVTVLVFGSLLAFAIAAWIRKRASAPA